MKVGGAGSFLFFDAPARLGECLRISISNLRFYSLLLLRCIFYSHFQRETCSVVFLLLMRGTSSRLGECPVAVRTFTMLVFFYVFAMQSGRIVMISADAPKDWQEK